MRTSNNANKRQSSGYDFDFTQAPEGIEKIEPKIKEDISAEQVETDDFEGDYSKDSTIADLVVDPDKLSSNEVTDANGEPVKRKKTKKGSAIIMGVVMSMIIGLSTSALYYNYITYPPLETRAESGSGLEALHRWNTLIANRDYEGINQEIGVAGYLAQEADYANMDEQVLLFMDNVLGTVSYSTKKIEGKNIYGNVKVDKNTKSTVYVEPLLNDEHDTVELTYIDYSKIQFNAVEVTNYLKSNNIKVGTADYSNSVVSIFCQYMNSLNWNDIATTTIERVPEIVMSDGVMKFSAEEDIFLDDLLFSSDEFFKLLDKFDLAANSGTIPVTTEWDKWNKLDTAKKQSTAEPEKYSSKYRIARNWCGAYYLQNVYTNSDGELEVVYASEGDGTLENPAAIGTGVITNLIVKEDGKTVAYPIKVTLDQILFKEDCSTYLADKDTRNRGLDESSQIRYAAMTFTVTNLSEKKLTITDNSSLADKSGNLSARTGSMYGLTTSVTLEPDESGTIETWVSSTELDRKYLIWGSDFQKKSPIVYFKVLAGASAEEEAGQS